MKCHIATVTLVLSLLGGAAWAQDVCPDYGDAGTHHATLYLRTDDPTICTATNGTYMKTSSTAYDLDIAIEVTGYCQVRINQCSGVPPVCQCVDGAYEFRYIGATILTDNGSSQIGSQINPSNLINIQSLDTRVPIGTSSTGNNWLYGAYEGTHVITSSTAWNKTSCNWTPTSFPQDVSLTVNAVKCEPKFWETSKGAIRHLAPPTPPDKVLVFLPQADPNMSAANSALDAAITEWNSAISTTGVEFQRTTTACGTGPACITVGTADQMTCGFSDHASDLDTGVIMGDAILRLKDTWASFTAQGLQRTFVHELGHFIGLNNYADSPACQIPDAAMQRQFDCLATTVMNDPKFSDTRPVVSTTYGGGPKTSCGF